MTALEFNTIEEEVVSALKEAFTFLKEKRSKDNYIIFLAEGEYRGYFLESHLNPYTIDDKEGIFKDESRTDFLIQFMNMFCIPNSGGDIPIGDNQYKRTIELMIYTHVWESKPFLKQLFRLAELCDGKSYPWEVTVPDYGKYKFISKKTRDRLRLNHLKIADVIDKGYHSQLRNAFAHSEYRFDDYKEVIHLDNYKDGEGEVEMISYEDWKRRFAYSILLSYHLIDVKRELRTSLPAQFGSCKFQIPHPVSKNSTRISAIHYDSTKDRFDFTS